ncbi:unnamed protein product [Echinostoma caproni]|uniref:TPR_REGION domain-containing protein n=1 Tax=Echinostoma caproni TaxID=27848 RepID=A0A183AWT5_9TREM|nr:unnamed protein product [Echinostoma caproni]
MFVSFVFRILHIFFCRPVHLRSQFREAAHEAAVLLTAIEKWSGSRPGALKWRFQSDLCYLIGMSLDGMKRYKAALVFFQMDARLAEHANIMLAKKRALDNIGRMYAALGKYKEALACHNPIHLTGCYFKENIQFQLTALLACRTVTSGQNIQASMICLEEAYNLALRTNRQCVINAVLEIMRTIYNMLSDDQDDDILPKCWSSSLLDMLKQETSRRSQFNMKIFRELLLPCSGAQMPFSEYLV